MAGDWIKMRHDLPDDPAVIGIAQATGLDVDTVVGKLHRVWSWADRQTVDGIAPHVPLAWIDTLTECEGFATATVSCGWLEKHGDGLRFPDFDKHNSMTAKRRAEGARRTKEYRRRKRDGYVTPKAHSGDGGVTERCYVPVSLRAQIYERDGAKCVYCGRGENERAPHEMRNDAYLTIDHVVPESRGGATSLDNCVTCCMKCNRIKNNRTPEEAGFSTSHFHHTCVTKPSPEKRREEKSIIPPIVPHGATRKSTKWTPKNDAVEAIYKAYPRKVGRGAALKAIAKALATEHAAGRENPESWMLAAVREFSDAPAGQPPAKGKDDFRPNPATWFNQERYHDDRATWQHGGKPNARSQAPRGKYDDIGFDAVAKND